MIPKTNEKEKAINLRKQGLTYSEILKQIPVAKSTLSLWLTDVGLSKRQKQKITQKRLVAALKGGEIRKNDRIKRTRAIYKKAASEIKNISKRELWLMGIMLYWAEGSKEKEGKPGSGIEFSNSDPRMVKLFLNWLGCCCGVKKARIKFGIYVHENSRHRIKNIVDFWSKNTGFSRDAFGYVYFKKHKPKTLRKNVGVNYNGSLKIVVKASSDLVRKVEGWVRGIGRVSSS